MTEQIHCINCDSHHDTTYTGDNYIQDYSNRFDRNYRLCKKCLHEIIENRLEDKK